MGFCFSFIQDKAKRTRVRIRQRRTLENIKRIINRKCVSNFKYSPYYPYTVIIYYTRSYTETDNGVWLFGN